MKTPFAQCKIRSLTLLHKKSKLQRHVESAQHKRALEQWHRARAPKALPTAGLTATKEATNGEASPKAGLTADAGDDIAEDPTTGIGYAHVVSVLTEVKRAGSASDFERSNATMRKCGAALPAGFDGRKVFQQLVRICAGVEKGITRILIRQAALVALQQDARDPWLLAMPRMVLWRLPKTSREGCLRAVRSVLPGGGPPWTAERVLQAHRFGVGDRGGVEQGVSWSTQ